MQWKSSSSRTPRSSCRTKPLNSSRIAKIPEFCLWWVHSEEVHWRSENCYRIIWKTSRTTEWSKFHEWFCGRGDKYDFSHKTSPIFNLTIFEIQLAGSVPWRTIAFDLRSRNGCKNSGKIWWMMKFHYKEALTPVRLMKPGKHNVHTHFPKDQLRDLQADQNHKGSAQKTQWRSRTSCSNFGDLITADHNVLSDNCESRNNHRHTVVVQDLATQWIQAYPCENKTPQETQRTLQKFLEPERKPRVICIDNSLEFGKACEDLSRNHCTSTPHRSETDGIAKRAVRRVKEGTSAVLLQSGLNESWWADSMECCTYLRNVTDLLSDGKTPCERHFGKPFEGTCCSICFTCWVSPNNCERSVPNPSIWKESSTWIVPRIRSPRGGNLERVTYWSQTLRSWRRWTHRKSIRKDFSAKEVISPQKGEFTFPTADGRIKIPGGEQELTTSTLIRPRPSRGEDQKGLFHNFMTHFRLPVKLCTISGPCRAVCFIFRHHVEPRVELYSPREESFPVPLKYIDVTRTTHTNLDVKQEKRIDDYWNIDGSRDLSHPWTGFTQFILLDEKVLDGHTWSGGRLTRKQFTSRPDHLWPE